MVVPLRNNENNVMNGQYRIQPGMFYTDSCVRETVTAPLFQVLMVKTDFQTELVRLNLIFYSLSNLFFHIQSMFTYSRLTNYSI